ncbi:hypothetical protein [Tissierella creatinophila]|uniref:Uncharacterized protein n=1 Tax=Tissierella creatinophila DSM 6911 TaxID=1123403 RepID=A0A1U7M6K4_TISCR|nr:hypothetical protein [Tissierella creatinophila]OLS02953.1 hypothetical protein TICRE_10100 [Tissierella creatinophila DSM 6911]
MEISITAFPEGMSIVITIILYAKEGETMKKYINIKKLYLFTFISFMATFLFLYIFTGTAEQFYTGWDGYGDKNIESIFIDVIFILLLLVNFTGIVLSVIYTFKIFFNKLVKKSK